MPSSNPVLQRSSLDAEAHQMLQRIVCSGDLVIDATTGNGFDTLFLAELVGKEGLVLAFDLQKQALDNTRSRLEHANCLEQVRLIEAGHESVNEYLAEYLPHYPRISAAMFNLGYLPGSDKQCVTTAHTTIAACESMLDHISPGGIVSIHAYTGHDGGEQETAEVLRWTASLPWNTWRVRHVSEHNKPKNREHLIFIQRLGDQTSVELPRQTGATEAPKPTLYTTANQKDELPPLRILAVDDARENLRLVVETLRNEYIMMVATSGEQALDLVQGDPKPDLILLDVVLPGINGYEVCRLLKENPETQDIPVLFITSASESNDEARGLGLGAMDYIHKPFMPELLKTRVRIQTELVRHRTQLEKLVNIRTHELVLTREVTIDTLANLAECRSLETGGHIRRTQRYVRLLAEALSTMAGYSHLLPRSMIEQLETSAPLHDVGKVGIPDSVLLKPGMLTTEEFELMKRHTIYGRDTMAAAERKLGGHSFLSIAKDIAYCHHERWDGKGYPQGLAGEWIPLAARIMSVADVYDAMRSERVYKPALSHNRSVDALFAGYGTHFDPNVLEAFRLVETEFHKISDEWRDDEQSPVKLHHL